jgi:hypothetical protein
MHLKRRMLTLGECDQRASAILRRRRRHRRRRRRRRHSGRVGLCQEGREVARITVDTF